MNTKPNYGPPSQADLNEDWIKTRPGSWDIRKHDHSLVKRAADLRGMGWSDEDIAKMLSLPVGMAAPESLLQDLAEEGFGRATEILDERALA